MNKFFDSLKEKAEDVIDKIDDKIDNVDLVDFKIGEQVVSEVSERSKSLEFFFPLIYILLSFQPFVFQTSRPFKRRDKIVFRRPATLRHSARIPLKRPSTW